MIWLEVLVLAVVQGIGEFLPISSSGHVVVGLGIFEQAGFPVEEKITVNVVLHVGTLLAILIVYRNRVWGLLGSERRLIPLLLVGSLPAALAGVFLREYLAGPLENPVTAGLMFPVTGVLLLLADRQPPGGLLCREMTYRQALLVGTFQAFAILPGISRSGATIAAGLFAGLRRDEAAAFAFLLAIPAIGGAGLLEARHLLDDGPTGVPAMALLMGGAVSFAVGLLSLWWLIRWLRRGKLHWFAWWVFAAGAAVLVWQFYWPVMAASEGP